MALRLFVTLLLGVACMDFVSSSSLCPTEWPKSKVFLTPGYYPTDLVAARERCEGCEGFKLCSLDQLKEAYNIYIEIDQWGLVDVAGKVARVVECTSADLRLGCYRKYRSAGQQKGWIPTKTNTDLARAYCCS